MTNRPTATDTATEGLSILDLRPCLLLVYSVSRRGGQRLTRTDEGTTVEQDGKEISEWSSRKVLDDPEEFKKATNLRNYTDCKLHKLGAPGPGNTVIVAKDREDEVKAAVAEYKADIRAFNETARYSRVDIYTGVFKIEDDNRDALQTMLEDLRDALSDLEGAYSRNDPKEIRDMLARTKAFTEVLPEEVAFTLENAIKAAKKKADGISRADKRSARLAAKIAEELGTPVDDSVDVEAEIAKLKDGAESKAILNKVRKVRALHTERTAALDRIAELKAQIDATPIRLARHAIQDPRNPVELDDATAEFIAARAARRAALTEMAAQLASEAATAPRAPRNLPAMPPTDYPVA